MEAAATQNWSDANQRYLVTAMGGVKQCLSHHAKGESERGSGDLETELTDLAQSMPSPPALEVLCESFVLSSFERAIVLMCAAMELEGSFPALCAVMIRSPGAVDRRLGWIYGSGLTQFKISLAAGQAR